MFRSTGWLWIATVCQALIQALHGQTPADSPAPSASPSAVQPVSEPEEWKVEGSIPEQLPAQPGAQQMPQTGAPEVPLEQEPGWSGELNNPSPENGAQFEVPPNQLPVDPRAIGPKLSLGPIDIRPSMQFGAEYSDNILVANTNQKRDVIYTVAPGLFLGVGDYLEREYNFITLAYIPNLNLYNHYSSLNSLDQHLRIDGQYGLARLKLSGYFGYDKAFGGNRDIGGLVNSEYYTMGAAAKYQISEKTSLEVLGDQTFSHYQNAIGSKEFVNHDWLNFKFTPKLTVSAGGAFGILQPDTGVTQTYEQGLVRVQFISTDKLSFSGNAGFEVRQFHGVGSRVTPVFGLSATYQIFPGTTFSVNGARNVTYSAAVTGSNYTATSVTASINQHLIGKLFIGVDGGFENDTYFQVSGASTGATQRQDNYFIVRPNLTYRWKDWASISVSYLYRDNSSNVPSKAFYNNQIGVQVHFGF